MIAYAARTGTRRNLEALRAAGWRLMLSATGAHRTEGFAYAIDNGAWTAHQRKTDWDWRAFLRLVNELGAGADFVVLPDIVGGGVRSLETSLLWLPRLWEFVCLIPVQNGMTPDHVRPYLGARIGIFVGGDDDFKLGTMLVWAALAREYGAWCHVGRVNTARRIRACALAGVDSFDGSSASRFVKTLRPLNGARNQTTIAEVVRQPGALS